MLFLLTSSFLRAQLTIENPKHLEVPELEAQTLFLNINRVVEKEFPSHESPENKLHVRLVLGESQERFTIDNSSGDGTVYLERWDTGKFATSTMRLALQHLLPPDRQKRLLEDVVRRTREIAPVPVAQLRKEATSAPMAASDLGGPDMCAASGAHGNPCMSIRRPLPMPVR